MRKSFGLEKKRSLLRKQSLVSSAAALAGLWLVSGRPVEAAVLYSNDFGTTAISGTTYTGSPTLAAGINSSVWSTSALGFTSFAGSSGQALSLSNSGGTPTITLTLTLDNTYTLALDSVSLWRQRSAAGAQAFSLSVNSTSVETGTVPTTGATTGAVAPSTTSFGGTNGLSTYTFVLGLSGATGSGTFRLDDFTLNGTLTAVVNEGRYWVGDDSTRGGSGTWVQTGGTAWSTTDADVAGGAWNTTTLAANFGGGSGAVTVSGTVNANAGMVFAGNYTISGGSDINLGGNSTAANLISVATSKATNINTALSGTTGFTKGGAGTLTISGSNSSLSGTVDVAAGTLVLGSATALSSATSVSFSTTAGVMQLGGNSVTIGDLNAANGSSIVENASAGNATLTVSGVGTFAGTLQDGTGGGTLALSKTGAGNLTVSGTNAFTGGVTIDTGTINIGSAAALNSLGVNALTMTNNGRMNLGGNSVTVASLNGTAGTIVENNIAVVTNVLTVNQASGTSTFNGTLQNGAGNGSLGLTKSGSGTLILGGTNTYTASTLLTKGTLKLTNAAALGTSAVNVTNGNLYTAAGLTVANNITVSTAYQLVSGYDFQTTTTGGTATAVATITPTLYNANFGSGVLYLDGTHGSSAWSQATELTAFAGTAVNTAGTSLSTVSTSPAALALLGGTGNSANGKFIVFTLDMTGKTGLTVSYATQGTTTGFANQNWSYSTDGTNWTAADSFTSIPTSFGTKTLTTISAVDNISTVFLRMSGGNATAASGNNRLDNFQFNAIDVTATPTLGSDATSGTATYSGNITINSAASLSSATGGTVDFTGALGGSAALNVIGGGVTKISGTSNTYSGAISVGAGSLVVNGNLAAGGNVTISSLGTLGGTGTVSRLVDVKSGGTIAPGNSAGKLTVGSVILEANSNLSMELNGTATAGTDYDQLSVSDNTAGSVNLTGSNLIVTLGFSTVLGDQFTIIDNAGPGAVIGQFATGSIVDTTYNGITYEFGISYAGGDGNDVVLTTTLPEPASLSLIGLGATGLLARRRRKNHKPAAV